MRISDVVFVQYDEAQRNRIPAVCGRFFFFPEKPSDKAIKMQHFGRKMRIYLKKLQKTLDFSNQLCYNKYCNRMQKGPENTSGLLLCSKRKEMI